MIAEEGPLFPRDHNLPAGMLSLEPAVAAFREFLNEREQEESGKTFAERKAEFLRAASNAVVRNRETAGSAADVIKLANRVWDALHAARLARSNPYRDVADALGRTAAEFWREVDEAMDGLLLKINTFTDAEDDRIAQQAREQEEALEQMRAAAAAAAAAIVPDQPASPVSDAPAGRAFLDYRAGQPAVPTAQPVAPAVLPAKKRKIHGDLGATIAATDRTEYTVADVRALPDYILNAPAVHAAIIAAVRGTVKVMGVPPGIATSTITTNTIR